jgi:hypothetical protein
MREPRDRTPAVSHAASDLVVCLVHQPADDLDRPAWQAARRDRESCV